MSERSTAGAAIAWLFAVGCALFACSSEPKEPEVGGDTHWLAACDDDRECGRGSCTCGLCTESCTEDAQCEGGPAARCYQTASPGVQAACATGSAPESEAEAICLARCSADRECGQELWCVGGACVTRNDSVVQPDAGLTASGLPATRASEFSDLESSVSFAEPAPSLLEPERDFVGAADPLIGTWTQPACDPADGESVTRGPGGCVTLVIARSAPSGAIRGEVRFRDDVDYRGGQLNQQEFAPAVDPDVGYPVEVGPEDYQDLGFRPSFGPYTLLDPFFDGTRLRFWLSPMELWDGWCKLQTSYRVPGGDPGYQCVPDGAPYGDPVVDYGKLVLCTSERSAGSCEEIGCAGSPDCTDVITVECNCRVQGNGEEGDGRERPECSAANCACGEGGCVANWYQQRLDIEATWDGEVLTLREGWDGRTRPGAAMGTLVREAAP